MVNEKKTSRTFTTDWQTNYSTNQNTYFTGKKLLIMNMFIKNKLYFVLFFACKDGQLTKQK